MVAPELGKSYMLMQFVSKRRAPMHPALLGLPVPIVYSGEYAGQNLHACTEVMPQHVRNRFGGNFERSVCLRSGGVVAHHARV